MGAISIFSFLKTVATNIFCDLFGFFLNYSEFYDGTFVDSKEVGGVVSATFDLLSVALRLFIKHIVLYDGTVNLLIDRKFMLGVCRNGSTMT